MGERNNGYCMDNHSMSVTETQSGIKKKMKINNIISHWAFAFLGFAYLSDAILFIVKSGPIYVDFIYSLSTVTFSSLAILFILIFAHGKLTENRNGDIHSLNEIDQLSLRKLDDEYSNLKFKIQRSESSREVYVAIWKSSPYFVISFTVAFLYLWAETPDIARFPFIGIAVMFVITEICWCMSIIHDKRISQLGIMVARFDQEILIKENQVRGSLEYIKDPLSSQYQESGDIQFQENGYSAPTITPFSTQMDYNRWDDAKVRFPTLTNLLESLHLCDVEFVSVMTRFNNAGVAKIRELEQNIPGMQTPQPSEKIVHQLRASYKVLSGQILDAREAKEMNNKKLLSNPEYHFVQLIFSQEDATNPYPKLRTDGVLNEIATMARPIQKNCQVKYDDFMARKIYLLRTFERFSRAGI